MTSRRDFLKQGGTAFGGALLAGSAFAGIPRLLSAAPAPDWRTLEAFTDIANVRALMDAALNAAKMAGASYADVRCSRQRQNFVFTREQQIQNVVDTDTVGIGVRALVDGTWGFAATRILTTDGAAAAAREAVAIARASKVARANPIEWLPAPAVSGVWKSAFTQDPFDVPVEEKADLLLRANADALKAKNVKYVFSGLFFVKEERNYANTDGSVIEAGRGALVAHDADHRGERPTSPTSRTAATWWPPWDAAGSTCCRTTWSGNARSGARRRREAHRQAGRAVGRYDLVLDPSNLWLTIHESSATRRSSTARWATRPTTRARASSRRRRPCSAAQVRAEHHEHSGRPVAGRRRSPRSAGTTTA
jgi:TldD protein